MAECNTCGGYLSIEDKIRLSMKCDANGNVVWQGALVNQIPEGAITTKNGDMIVLTTGGDYILTVEGFIPLNALRTTSGDVVKTKNLEFITT